MPPVLAFVVQSLVKHVHNLIEIIATIHELDPVNKVGC